MDKLSRTVAAAVGLLLLCFGAVLFVFGLLSGEGTRIFPGIFVGAAGGLCLKRARGKR